MKLEQAVYKVKRDDPKRIAGPQRINEKVQTIQNRSPFVHNLSNNCQF